MQEDEIQLTKSIHDKAEEIARVLEQNSELDRTNRVMLVAKLELALGEAKQLLARLAGNQPQNRHRI